jgi:hypothetical protein
VREFDLCDAMSRLHRKVVQFILILKDTTYFHNFSCLAMLQHFLFM